MELIDTLWNVNKKRIQIQKLHLLELIDTLWNVNKEKNGKLLSTRD